MYNVHREHGTAPIVAADFLPLDRPGDVPDDVLADQLVGVFAELGNLKEAN